MSAAVGIRAHNNHPAMTSAGVGSHNRPSLFGGSRTLPVTRSSAARSESERPPPRQAKSIDDGDSPGANPSQTTAMAYSPDRSIRPSLNGTTSLRTSADSLPGRSNLDESDQSSLERVVCSQQPVYPSPSSSSASRRPTQPRAPDLVVQPEPSEDGGTCARELPSPGRTRRSSFGHGNLDDISEDGTLNQSTQTLDVSRSPSPASESPSVTDNKKKRSFSVKSLFGRKSPTRDLDPADGCLKNSKLGKRSLHSRSMNSRSKIPASYSEPVIGNKSSTAPQLRLGGAPGERSEDGRLLHLLTKQCCTYLTQRSVLDEEGLFRVPGNQTKIKQMRQQFLASGRCDFSNVHDPHLVAGLLKLHFRELKFALVPHGDSSKDLLDAAKTKNLGMAKRCLAKLPFTYSEVLRDLISMFVKLAANRERNLMTLGAIGRSCGPSIFHSYGVQDAGMVLTFLIENSERVFSRS